MKIIKGEKDLKYFSTVLQTKVSVTKSLLDLGAFSWNNSPKSAFQLRNIGDKPLVISDAISSCGCTKINYEKQPIRPNQETELTVTYKADHKEHFNKTIAVYCNAEESPIQLRITGNAR